MHIVVQEVLTTSEAQPSQHETIIEDVLLSASGIRIHPSTQANVLPSQRNAQTRVTPKSIG